MKSTNLILILCLISILVGCQKDKNILTYQKCSSNFGLEYSLPDNWEYISCADDAITIFNSTSLCYISLIKQKVNQPIDTAFQEEKRIFELMNDTLIHEGKIVVAGFAGYYWEYTLQSKNFECVFTDSKNKYKVRFNAKDEEAYIANKSVFDKFLLTISVK